MADLPKERLTACRAFEVSGVDFCGRNKALVKCYMAVFICFATKAAHLELVKVLSTASFLNALKRFISTRCRPSQIWSDNATNFVGTKNELLELKRLFISHNHIDSVHKFCMADSIDWKIIPLVRRILATFGKQQ
ncbi:uncharacterized protein LOC135430114 [Drosophila montana]|uniref:uncharacterized protein LOC135430114 n=1 Tax=Drosophila montana TaxID=40370 RepID=UPI00313E9539